MLVLAAGIAASIFVPQVFPQSVGDIPAFALFPGEIAVALILSVLLFENASPAELIKIAGFMLIIAFLDGAFCNMIGGTTTWLPEATFRLNWVQLIAFNVTGMGAIMAYYTTDGEPSPYNAVRDSAPAKDVPKIDFSPAEEKEKEKEKDKPQPVSTGAEAQDIISSLDVGRINQLEQSISTSPEKVSLESLFAEETQAASSTKKKDEPSPVIELAPPVAPVEEPVAQVEPAVVVTPPPVEPEPAPAPAEPAVSAAAASDEAQGRLFGDVSNDIENIFNDLVGPDEAQKDFAPATKESAEAPPEDKPPVAPPPGPAETPPVAEVVDATPPAEEAPQNFGPQLTDAGTSAKTAVKEFGKLSAAAHKPDSSTGTLKTIGQMLLDTAAVERIIKSADKAEGGSKWRVLTVDRGANLQALMDKLGSFEGVESALLFGKDGLLLSNTESLSAMKYVYGPLSLAMHSTTGLGTAKLQMGELRQCVLKSGDKVSILTDVGSAILCVFAEWNVATLDSLMEFIGKAISGSEGLDGELPEEVPDLSEAPAAEAKAPEPEPVVEAAPAAKAAEPQGGIMSVSDNEMSDLFDNLLDESSGDKKKDAPAPAAKAAEPAGGIMNVSDNEMSDLFDNLLDEKSGDKKKDEPAPAAAKPAAAAGGIMNVSDNEMSDLFDNLLAEGSPAKDAAPAAEKKEEAPTAPVAEEKPAAEKPAAEKKPDKKKEGKPPEKIKEFGKLSATAAKQEAPTGEGGAMKAIGRQLIDVQAVENIIKAGEKREKIGSGLTTARVISAARGEGIKTLLSQIDTYPGVIGSLIVGHDGLVIASTLQSGIDKDMMGALCTAIHSHTDVATKKCDHGKLQQIVFLSEDQKATVMTGVAVGILAVFVDNVDLPAVDGLLQAIETTVRG
jgi:predicted regulator of Ras-like GTPase activity (Roadblock/LC7/MglB family)